MSHSTITRVCVVVLALLGLAPAAQAAAPLSETEAITDGSVTDIAVDADSRRYLAGGFSMVGPRVGHGLALTTTDDQPNLRSADITGSYVRAVVADGSGGWYVGGLFTRVGGVARRNLAHILADGTVDPAFDPSPNNYVATLGRSGSTLYVGGSFTTVGGQTRNRIAALDATTGLATGWNPNANNVVETLAVSGATLYVGGSFTTVGGQTRNRIAALDITSGLATSWNPNANNSVFAIAVRGATVFVGGAFTSVGGQARNRIAALDSSTGVATSWNPNADNTVRALAVDAGAVYAGGQFTAIGGAARNRVAKLDASTGLADAGWNANVNEWVYSLALDGGSLYIGGRFSAVGGTPRARLARVDTTTGTVDGWDPNTSDIVYAVATDGTKVYAGGYFEMAGAGLKVREGLARLNADGTLDTGWVPPTGGPFNTVEVVGDKVFVGGAFLTLNGQPQARIAKLDAATAAVEAWNPQIGDNVVVTITAAGGKVYFAGNFTTVGGAPRHQLARADLNGSGAVDTSWNPPTGPINGSTYPISAVTVAGGHVYYGGQFQVSDPTTPTRIARVSVADGTYDASWTPVLGAPGLGATVSAIHVIGDQVYAGGVFTTPVTSLAKISATTGVVDTSWAPNPDGDVMALSSDRAGRLLVGGTYTTIAGGARANLARLLPAGALDSGWDPNVADAVQAFARVGASVAIGGAFGVVNDLSVRGYGLVALPSGRLRLTAAGDAGTFGFNIDGGAVAAGVHTLEPDTYAITETGASGHVVDYECRGGDGSGAVVVSGSGAGPVNVPLGVGDQVRCVFTNTLPTPPPGPSPTPTPTPTPDPPTPTPEPPAPTPVPPAAQPTTDAVIGAKTGGHVKIKGGGRFRDGTVLTATSIIDATRGFIGVLAGDTRLTISRGVFSLDGPSLTLRMRGGKGCATRRLKVSTAAGVTVHARFASSTPVGGAARWVTIDRCGETSIRVYAGTVRVRDLRTGKTVTVRAGRSRVVSRT